MIQSQPNYPKMSPNDSKTNGTIPNQLSDSKISKTIPNHKARKKLQAFYHKIFTGLLSKPPLREIIKGNKDVICYKTSVKTLLYKNTQERKPTHDYTSYLTFFSVHIDFLYLKPKKSFYFNQSIEDVELLC